MVNFIQQTAFKGTLGQCLLQDTGFAGTFYKIPDFKIIFIFKVFLCHFFRRSSKVAKALSGFYLTTFCQELKVALTGCGSGFQPRLTPLGDLIAAGSRSHN